MDKTDKVLQLIEGIATKSGLDTKNAAFLNKAKSAVYNNFLNDDTKIPAWLVQVLESILYKKGISQTSFTEDKREGDVDNFMHDISDALFSTIEDEGEIYSIDFTALSMQLIVMRMGSSYEVVNYNEA